jgi:Uma2 family endonuclease
MLTIYNEEENRYQLVEEPDPSLSYTYADYLQWKFKERLELIKGHIYKMSPAPAPKHQQVAAVLTAEIFQFLKKKKCKVYPAPFDVRLPVKNRKKDNEVTTVVQPDICLICDETKIDERGCCGAPDLVIEILSPGNSSHEVKIKFELYEEAGVKEYWLVNPAEENLVVFILNEEGKFEGLKMYAGGDTLSSTVVAGSKIKVSEIFTK